MLEAVLRSLNHVTTRRKGWVVLALVLLTALAVRWSPNFRFQPDVSKMLPADNPVVMLQGELEKHAPNSRLMVVDIRGEQLEGRMKGLVRRLEESPNIEEVQARREDFLGDNWPLVREAPLSFMPVASLDALAERMAGEDRAELLRERRRTVAASSAAGFFEYMADPLGLRELMESELTSTVPLGLKEGSPYLVTADDRRAILRIKGVLESLHVDFSQALLAEIDQILEEECPGASWSYYGEYARSKDNLERIREDLGRSLVVSAVLVTLFLVLSMRRLTEPLLIFFPVVLSVGWALPYGGTLLGPMTPLTVSAAALLVGLGADFSIHWLVRYSYERQGRAHDEASRRTLRGIGKPLTASMLTSVVAFLALGRAEFTGLRNFGLLLALGLFLAFLASVLVMPLLLGLRSSASSLQEPRWVGAMDRLARSGTGRILAAVLLVLTGAGFTLAVVRGVEFRSDLQFVQPPEDAFLDAGRRFEEELGFSVTPAVVLLGPEWEGPRIAEAVDRLVQAGAIRFSDGPHLAHPTPSRREAIDRFRERTEGWAQGTISDLEAEGYEGALFAGGFRRFEEVFRSDLGGWKSEPVDFDGRTYQKVVCFPAGVVDTEEQWAVLDEQIQEAFGEEVISFHPQATLDEVCRILINDLIRAALITMVLGTLVVALLSGGVKAGLFAMLPTLSGFGLTLGALSAFDVELNMGNCVAIPLLLGIGVDHGVHLVAHFNRTGTSKLGSCGVAIWRSSATSMVGFGALMVAKAPGIATMGWISILGVGACLLTSLCVLPVLWPEGEAAGGPGDEGDSSSSTASSRTPS